VSVRALLPLLLLLLLSALAGCVEEEAGEGNVQTGECEAGELWCVDTSTIQNCPDGEWTDPEECAPENAGSVEVPVVIPTICGDYGCQPG
jgi:hypothetical protein